MPDTTNFNYWLSQFNLYDHNLLFELYNTVYSRQSCGQFDINKLNGQDDKWTVKSNDSDLSLLLLSEEARTVFIKILDVKTPDAIGVEAYYSLKKDMEKTDIEYSE